MPKRTYTYSVKCAEDGCHERAHYRYETRREYQDGVKWRMKYPYRCVRHENPEKLLSTGNLSRMTTLEATEGANVKDSLFWDGTNGYVHGPGFKALANDFPKGTKLIVHAYIQLPETPED